MQEKVTIIAGPYQMIEILSNLLVKSKNNSNNESSCDNKMFDCVRLNNTRVDLKT